MKEWFESPWRSNAVQAAPEKRKASTDKPAKKAKVTASETITAASGAITATGTSTAASSGSAAETVTVTKDQATQLMQMMFDMKKRLEQPLALQDGAPSIAKVEKLAIKQVKQENRHSICSEAACMLYRDEEFKNDPETKKYVARMIVDDYYRGECPVDVRFTAAWIYMKRHCDDPAFVNEAMRLYPPPSSDDEDGEDTPSISVDDSDDEGEESEEE